MKHRLLLLLLFAARLACAQFVPHAPAKSAYCLNPSSQWIPIAAVVSGSQLPNGAPATDLYGINGSTWYGIACDQNGNVSAGAIDGVTLPALAQGFLYSASPNGPFSWTTPQAQIASTQSIYSANGQITADSLVSSTAFGLDLFGDSITVGNGATVTANDYASILQSDYALPEVQNLGVGGDTALDQSWHVFTSLNPSDTGNPIATSVIGTNDANTFGSGAVPGFTMAQYASATWLGLSSKNKILAGNALVTPTGSTSADTTFAFANGVACGSGTCTLTYPTAQVGSPGRFYIWYSTKSTGGSFSVTVDGGTALVDQVSGNTSISGAWGTDQALHQTVSPAAARFLATRGQHSIVITISGAMTIYGFGFPPTTRLRGVSGPRLNVGNVPPQMSNALASTIALFNAADLGMIQKLAADGLNIPLVDINGNVDYNLDWAGSALQNCPASTSPGLHPGDCGHRHIAQIFESVINATPQPAPATTAAAGSLACAEAADPTIGVQTVTAGSSTSSTMTYTMSAVPGYMAIPGQIVQAQGNTPSGYNAAPLVVLSATSTTVTVTSTNNPGTMTGFGTVSLYCQNRSTDALAATPVTMANSYTVAAHSLIANPGSGAASLNVISQDTLFVSSAPPMVALSLKAGSTVLLTTAAALQPSTSANAKDAITAYQLTGLAPAETLVNTDIQSEIWLVTNTPGSFVNSVVQPMLITNVSFPLNEVFNYTATGVVSINVSSIGGCTVSGTSGQTVLLTAFNDSSTATATVTLNNTVAAGALSPSNVGSITITSRGQSATAAPTSATCTAGTVASASGSASFTSVLGGAPGNAILQKSFMGRTY